MTAQTMTRAAQTLTDSDVSTIANALRAAADSYQSHAMLMKKDSALVDQFNRQRDQALKWAALLEQAESVTIR